VVGPPRAAGGRLTSRLENQGWSFNFALAASGPAIVDADLPTTPGAYALVDGHWQPLPRNNGHTTYAAAQMLSGVLSALHNSTAGYRPVKKTTRSKARPSSSTATSPRPP